MDMRHDQISHEGSFYRLGRRCLDFALDRPGRFFLALALILALDLLIFREKAVIPSQDVLDSPVPYLASLFKLIKEHGIVSWYPLWGPGMPVLSSQFPWWRPETLLYLFFTPFWVYVLQYVIAVFVAGYFMYLFLTRVEGQSPGLSLFSGIVFTTAASRYIPDVTSIAAVPLFLYCFDRWVLAVGHPKLRHVAGCLYYIFSVNLVYMQPYAVLLHFTLWLRLVATGRYPKKTFLHFFGLWFLYGLAYLPQVYNMLVLEYAGMGRAKVSIPYHFEFSFFPPLREHNVLIVGLVALSFFAAIKSRAARFYLVWFALALPFKFVWAKLGAFLPVFGSVQCRIGDLLPFFSAVLVSYGAAVLVNAVRDQRRLVFLTGALAVVLPFFVLWLQPVSLLTGLTFAAVSGVVFLSLLRIFVRHPATLLPLLLLSFIFLRFLYKPIQILESGPGSFNYYFNYEALHKIQEIEGESQDPFRVVHFGIQPVAATFAGLETADMYNPFYSWRYKKFWQALVDVGETRDEEYFNSFANGHGVHVDLPMPHSNDFSTAVDVLPFHVKLLALANVKYLVSRVIINNPERFGLVPVLEQSMVTCRSILREWERLKCQVGKHFLGRPQASLYRLSETLPRYFLVPRARIFEDQNGLYRAMRDDSLAMLKGSVYLEKNSFAEFERDAKLPLPRTDGDDAVQDAVQDAAGTITQTHYAPDEIEVALSLTAPGYFVMSDGYSDRWRCDDNAAPLPMVPAYGAFRVLFLQKGEHVVRCAFQDVIVSAIRED